MKAGAGLLFDRLERAHPRSREDRRAGQRVENIGARRLQTVMERLLEELSFEAEDRRGETVTVDAAYVRERLADLAGNSDLSKYIL